MSYRRGGSGGRPSYDRSWRDRSPPGEPQHDGSRDGALYDRRSNDRRSYDGQHDQRASYGGPHHPRSSYGTPPQGDWRGSSNYDRQPRSGQSQGSGWNDRSDRRSGPSRGDGWHDRHLRGQGWHGEQRSGPYDRWQGDDRRSSYGTPRGGWQPHRGSHQDRSSDNHGRDRYSGAGGNDGRHGGLHNQRQSTGGGSNRGGFNNPKPATRNTGRYTDIQPEENQEGPKPTRRKFERGDFWQYFSMEDLTCCVVRNLAPEVDEGTLFELFHQAGPVYAVKIKFKRGDRRGYIFYADSESARYAEAIFANVTLYGRPIGVRAPKLYVERGDYPDYSQQQEVSTTPRQPPPSLEELQRERDRIKQAGALMPLPRFMSPISSATPPRGPMPPHFMPRSNMFTPPPGVPMRFSTPSFMGPPRGPMPGNRGWFPPPPIPPGMEFNEPMGFRPPLDFGGNVPHFAGNHPGFLGPPMPRPRFF